MKAKPKIILTKGLPASGKSTWAIQEVEKNPNVINVCKDDLRQMLHAGKHSKGREEQVKAIRDQIIKQAVEDGNDVIVSDTNLDPRHEEHIRELFGSIAEVSIKDFTDVSLEECIKRDSKREENKRVGAKVIRGMYNKYLRKTPTKFEQDSSLPKAIIVDIDGTLAIMGNRGPFEWYKVGLDSLNEYVLELVNMYKKDGYKIIVMSGRDSVCRIETEEWLNRMEVPYDHLYMRQAGDSRKDAIVKRQLFDFFVDKIYFVQAIIDDRNQMIRMWKDMGMNVLSVGHPDDEF